MITYSIIKKSELEGALRIDAEYYQPEYMELEQKIKTSHGYRLWRDVEGKFITGPFGSEFNVENYISDGEYRYVRGKDVKDFFLENDDNVYIPKKDFNRLKKYSLNFGDILVSVVGTLGNTIIIYESNLPAIFSCKSTVFRTKSISPYYFLAYLNSKYGQSFLQRSVRGALQTGLNINDLKDLPIFIPSINIQENIASVIQNAKLELENSRSFYIQAEKLLLEEVGVKKDISNYPIYNIVNFSQIQKAKRMDAEYFQPGPFKFGELVSITDYKVKPLSEVVESVSAKFDSKKEPNKNFKYVELSNINSSIGTIDGFSEVLGKEAPSRAKRILKAGDVLVSSVQGSLGKVALIEKGQQGHLASTGFFQFRSKEILPEVLLVLAKSTFVQSQLEQRCAGTILTAVPKESIKDIFIPIVPKPTQEKIANLIHRSHEARKKSKELLEEAKRKVEELIEKRE